MWKLVNFKKFVSYRYSACLQAWGKQLGQMLEALPQVLGKVFKHKCKYFNKVNASSTKYSTLKCLI